jgi:hypothetical protein
MKKTKTIITVGIISLLLLLFLTGCGTEPLKSAQNTSQEVTVAEDGSSEEGTTDESSQETTTDESDGEPAEDGSDVESAGDGSDVEPTENPETNCSSLNPHPMAEGMAEQFDVTYDEVMTWYCDGFAFSDILLALETEELVEQSTEELLNMLENSTWEEIWGELGVEK